MKRTEISEDEMLLPQLVSYHTFFLCLLPFLISISFLTPDFCSSSNLFFSIEDQLISDF